MKIAIYGATGMVGSQITAEALHRGHSVTAISRSGTAVNGATALAADLCDTAGYTAIAGEHDIVVLSVAPDRTGEPHDSFVAMHRAIIAAPSTSRLLVVGGAGALSVDGVQLKDTPGFPAEYHAEASTFSTVLDLYRASTDLDWTMLAPAPEIAPGDRTGHYVLGLDSPAGSEISTQDFAVAALDELETPAHERRRFTVAH
ncbi:NAD(P)-dependent oxidoreductase [Cryobacterium aureum]|uniref:NAD(P)-dependent oxidoreductase n=1 Tax=Cryobacterium aureum TaxID=995037 RepID=UPI000CF53744|nr:NAD(P)H-binding protein [Cryobacterium aureum]